MTICNVSAKSCIGLYWGIGIVEILAMWLLVDAIFAFGYVLPIIVVMGICYTISFGKKFVLDEKGCTVCFLGYRKTYLWEELKCKRVEDCYNYRSRDFVRYKRMVTLSTRNLRKRAVIQPDFFTGMIRPFSSIYFYFELPVLLDKQSMNGHRIYRLYEVDETLFWEKMNEWGVEFEEDKTS